MRRLLIALTLLAVGACGAGGGGDGNDVASLGKGANAAAGKATEKDRERAMLDFAKCMREHGIDMPDPQTDGKGGIVHIAPGKGGPVEGPPDHGKFEEADKACRHHIEGLDGGRGPAADPEMQDKLLKFARCMREHGVDMPDPSGEGGRVAVEIRAENKDKVDAAHKACESVAPFKAGGGSGVEQAK